MTEDQQPQEDSDSDDLGTPVVQLLDHAVSVSPHFRARVSRAIERRVLAADAAQFGILAPLSALLELVRAIFEGLGIVDADPDVPDPTSETEG